VYFFSKPGFSKHNSLALETVLTINSVDRYDTSRGCLTLQHDFPHGSRAKVTVDIKLLLSTLKSTDTDVGEWVNVIGYITTPTPIRHPVIQGPKAITDIQAIVLWSAGPLKIDQYENMLSQITVT
jgi:hypothetical protein